MNATDLEYTDKWSDVLGDNSQVTFLEGPSQTSKTTLAGVKLVYECLKAPQGQTIIYLCGESTPTLYRNFIEPETGITKLFPHMTKYFGGGSSGGQRIEIEVPYGKDIEVKKVFFIGYSNKTSANKVLGGKPYLIFADEFNKAHDQFVKEVMTRIQAVGTKLIATSNGDDPDLLFYQYLNACRPLPEYEDDVPESTQEQLAEVEPKPGWTYYFFGLGDRPMATQQWIEGMYQMHPKGSFEFNSKVLGIRAAVDGILYGHLLTKLHDIDFEQLNIHAIKDVICGVDVGSGGDKTAKDKKRAKSVFVLLGYSTQYQRVVVLDGMISNEILHTETIRELNEFLEQWYRIFQHRISAVYIDNAEPALIAAGRQHIKYGISVKGSIKSNALVSLKTRVTMKEQLIHKYRMLFLRNPGAQMVKKNLAKVKGHNGEMIDEDEVWNDISDATDYAQTSKYSQLQKVRM